MLMKRLLLATVMTLALTCPAAALAATVLSDTELGGVTGGGIAPELGGQALSQDQQQPQDPGSGYAPPRELPINQGMDRAPGYFAILQSSVEARRERNLVLGGASQQGAMALEIVNTLSSDVVSTSNIFDGSSLAPRELPAEIEIHQGNSLNQLHRTQGRLDSSLAGYRYETTVEHRSGTVRYDRYAFSLLDRQRGSAIERTESSAAQVQVGGRVTSFDDLTAGILPLPLIPVTTYGPYFPFPLNLGGIVDLGLAGKYGGTLAYDGPTLAGLGLTLDHLTTQGKDLVLGTSLKLPALHLGTLKAEGCLYLCQAASAPLGSIGGGTLPQEFKLPGLGPWIDALNLGSGFAMVGTAAVAIGKPDLSLTGRAGIKVTPWLNLTLDLSQAKFAGVNIGEIAATLIGRNTWSYSERLGLIDLAVPFSLDLKELMGKPYAGNVAGGTLLAGDGTGNGTQATGEEGKEWDDTTAATASFDVAESSYSESREHSVFTGGQMAAAEAEMIALSDGTLDVNHTSNVQLGDGAQQGMRTVNGVNAVSSVAANALNVSRMPTIRAGAPAGARSITTQQNRFNQRM